MDYLVFFARDPIDDALAGAIVERVRTCPAAGWFDDPGAASPAERTTGGYVRVSDPEEADGQALLGIARDVSAALAILVEVQWREEILGQIASGTWVPGAPSAA